MWTVRVNEIKQLTLGLMVKSSCGQAHGNEDIQRDYDMVANALNVKH